MTFESFVGKGNVPRRLLSNRRAKTGRGLVQEELANKPVNKINVGPILSRMPIELLPGTEIVSG